MVERKSGSAACRNGHRWSAVWWLEESPAQGGLFNIHRIVEPLRCPTCGEKWHRIDPPAAAESA